MPQIGQLTGNNWYLISQIFWLVLVFGTIFFVIGRGMLPKVEATVDVRDRKIADDLAAAKSARDAADKIEADWQAKSASARADAQGVVAAAKAKAAKDAEKRLAKANAEIESRLSAAEAEISAARSSAMAEVEAVAGEVAQDLVSRLTGAKVSAAAAAQAVKAQINV
jgi:F-type H+-transporting ATPase subunit b